MKIRFFFLALIFCTSLFSEDFSISAFLKTAGKDYSLENHDELLRYYKDAGSGTPWIEKAEIRTSTDEFDIEREKYALRFYPRGFGETNAAEKYLQSAERTGKIERTKLLAKALKKRANIILDYFETKEMIRINTEHIAVYRDIITVIKKRNSADVDFDVNALIEAENKLSDLQMTEVQLGERLERVFFRIKKIIGETNLSLFFENEKLIPIEKIEAKLSSIDLKNSVNLDLQVGEENIRLAEERYELEKAKARNYLSFLEIGYDSKDRDENKKAISLEVAFKLPFIESDQLDLNQRKARVLMEKLSFVTEKETLSEEQFALQSTLRKLIGEYKILIERKTSGSAELSFKKYLTIQGINPATLLAIKENMLKSDSKLIEITFLIRNRFLDLMDLSGNINMESVAGFIGDSN